MKRYLLGTLASLCAVTVVNAQAPNDTLAKIKASGKVIIGTRESSAPLAYTSEKAGTYVGYHVDICNRIADAIKSELKTPNLTTEYMAVTSQNRIPLLTNNTIDLECGSTNNNSTRKQQVAFAPTTYVVNVRMLVRADSPITSVSQLEGKTVVTTTGTTSVQLLRKNQRAANLKFDVISGRDHGDSFLVLQQGRADAFVMDDNILAGVKASAANPAGFKIVGETLSEEPSAIMYRKDDPAFKKVVDNAVIALMRSGEVDKLYAKWFVDPIPPRNVSVNIPMSAALKNAIANPNDKPAEDYAAVK
ncbi:amino acid ABC transporter substrate-binding protein [Rhodococcus sp. SRB_17]|uniref:transporter substrate-binding domain-containing protein n=1 Tax=Acidovorax sp. SRB_24 TaxID=1962700 RepID=UPI00145D0A24|nr:transporter substrate-binding domain-containing protein [Acidovorax sp. SRB_24]NMM78874.1 amino acid ABC transporter substrate-binding protein [Acidovorax sp. SRB_24]NMM92024.1 amino acid ABC transporter substrate-binding protein [Rhodococcus sp. SRB_17]